MLDGEKRRQYEDLRRREYNAWCRVKMGALRCWWFFVRDQVLRPTYKNCSLGKSISYKEFRKREGKKMLKMLFPNVFLFHPPNYPDVDFDREAYFDTSKVVGLGRTW